ncbi:MAG TPA: radical SAM protein [Chloroflexi bacterium]|nr:radical SAM protein [Chloroflexota bacterium]HPO57668.1 radical SAM protein [Anaerolineaceae bacterium]
MKERFRLWYERLFGTEQQTIEPGVYQYTSPQDQPNPYRLHLRIDREGRGTLILNASTVLHLNQTAAEYAYHLVRQDPVEEVAKAVSSRYNVSEEQARGDYTTLMEQIQTLIETPDLEPVTFLGFDRSEPYTDILQAPYRIDCALTYKTSGENQAAAPVDRVRREMTTGEWKSILKKVWDAGVPQVIFTGGEPTLRPDLPELIRYAEELGQVTGLLSNGDRLTDPQYMHDVLYSGLDHIMLTLDPDNEISWEALKDLLAEDIFVTVHLTLTPRLVKDFSFQMDRLKTLGVTHVSLSASSAELKPALLAAREQVAAHDLNLVWDLPVPYSDMNPVSVELESTEEAPVGAGKAWLYVEPDGDVLPGQGINRPLGNLLEEDWDAIWSRAHSG